MTSLPKVFKIKKIVDESKSVKTFFLDGNVDMKPGQFFMVWLPRVDEKPFTLSYVGDKTAVSIRKNGKGTEAFHRLKIGDRIGLRGPFGKSFSFKDKGKKTIIVAGGIGSIALASLADELSEAKIIIGSKSKEELVFAKRWKNVSICTDDGSAGEKMFAPQLLEIMLGKNKFKKVYVCGPEIMIKATLDVCMKNKIPMEATLERYMKCGMGICASCTCGGKLVCKDGPVFTDKELLKMEEFGNSALLMSGKKVSLKEFYSWKQK